MTARPRPASPTALPAAPSTAPPTVPILARIAGSTPAARPARRARRLPALALAAWALAFANAAPAQTAATAASAPSPAAPADGYVPEVGQPGKDVVWVPTPQALVGRMLDMAALGPDDRLIDLGSGDGRTVVTAARRGARALGLDLNPDLVRLARQRAEREGVADRARFEVRDLFEQDLSDATVITLFLLTEINLKLRPTLLALRPGTRIVSNTFGMGDWDPDRRETVSRDQGCDDPWCTALLWIVPARVAGTHRTDEGVLVLEQAFQRLTGSLQRRDGRRVKVTGTVRGEVVTLDAGGRALRGTFRDGRLEVARVAR
ncbi:MAG TPA: class I SAM-dependent methyltransferase [Burkholderiaceae bacterium]|nr:class I SAM-dependent methyltransferase [Burkholderiaceae bacterium]